MPHLIGGFSRKKTHARSRRHPVNDRGERIVRGPNVILCSPVFNASTEASGGAQPPLPPSVQQRPSLFHRWNLRPPCTLDLIVGERARIHLHRRQEGTTSTSSPRRTKLVIAAIEAPVSKPAACIP